MVSYSHQKTATLFHSSDFTGRPESSSIYMGIKPAAGTKNIENLICYFDLLNFASKELLVHHLGIANWSINGELIDVIKGYAQPEIVRDDYSSYISESIQTKIQFYEEFVREFYRDHFYTLEGSIDLNGKLKKISGGV